MLKKISFLLIPLLILVFAFYISNLNHGFAGELYSLEGYTFKLSQLDEESNEVQDINFIINKEGHFYKEIIQGNGKGDFEAWDGEKFYRYSKEYNDLMIVNSNEKDGKVIAHPFLSEIINQNITNDLTEGVLKKTSLFSSEYKKQYSVDNKEIVELLSFDEKLNVPKKYVKKIENEIREYIEISNIVEYQENLDIQSKINLDSLIENGVYISDI